MSKHEQDLGLVKIYTNASSGGGGGGGTVTSIGLSMPTPANQAFSVSGTPVTVSGTLAVSANGTIDQYIDGTGALQNSVAFTTVGTELATIPDPSAIRYLRIDADNGVTALTATQLREDLGFITQTQTSQLSNSSTTVPVNITGCSFTLEANSTYIGKMTIASGSVPAVGYSLTFTFPSFATILVGRISSAGSVSIQRMEWQSATSGVALTNNFGTAQNQFGYAELQLSIVTGITGGTFMPSFLTGSTGSAITIYAGLTSIALQKI